MSTTPTDPAAPQSPHDDPRKAVSPKVVAATVAGFLAPVLVAVLDAVTADLFTGLPPAVTALILAGVSALSVAVAGYRTRDPLRRG